jgi:hypothetical protein
MSVLDDVLKSDQSARSARIDGISSITFTTLDSDKMMKKKLKSRTRSKLDGISESEKVKSREERIRDIINKKYGELNDFEKSLVEDDKKLVPHLNFRNLMSEDSVFEKKYESEYKKEFKEEYKNNELFKMKLIKDMMKELNVTLEDINVNIINRYEEKINKYGKEEIEKFKDLKNMIYKTFRLNNIEDKKNIENNVKDNFKVYYFMLIRMIKSSCDIISSLKRKKIGSFDKINYYDLNKDYEEHMKIIKNVEEILE